jgi:RNA polymerase sigma-70 factor (ECF subfamily)
MAVITPDLLEFRALPAAPIEPTAVASAPSDTKFRAIYAEHVDLVWRGLRGLGVPEASVEDAVQDVFLVVHRRLESFEARSSFRTWLFGIVLRIARNHRRREQRKGGCASLDAAPEIADAAPGPHEEAATAEALRSLALALGSLDEMKREVFVLAELEQMSAPEIAETLGINVNTVYSRLRVARREFEAAVARKNGGRR